MVRKGEWIQFGLLLGVLFTVTLNIKLLKIIREALVVTAPESGAEIIPFLKTWLLIPISLVLIAFFELLSRRTSRENVFYIMTSLFLVYFAAFYFVIYPWREMLHPHAFCDYLEFLLPDGLHGLILSLRYWTFALFFAVADMWSTILLSLIFWNFVNGVVQLDQAKRFYALFSLDLGGVGVGLVIYLAPSGADDWDGVFRFMLGTVIFMGLLQMVLFRVYHRVFKVVERPSKRRLSLSWREKIAIFSRAPYVVMLAVMVFSYEFSEGLLDVLWKGQLVQLFNDPEDYSRYMGRITFITGVFGTVTVLFLSSKVLQNCRWVSGALVAPTITMIVSTVFFACLLSPRVAAWIGYWLGMHSLQVVVSIGAIQCLVMQVTKYTFFDNTKEIAFLLQRDHERARNKAFADAFAARLGKAGSAITYQAVLMGVVTLQAAGPYVACIVLPITVIWWLAAARLGTLVDRKLEMQHSYSV